MAPTERGLDLRRERSPSELRQLLEVRTRRSAETYPLEVRLEAMRELEILAGHEAARLEATLASQEEPT